MKRFLVFGYCTYYPGGGMQDFEGFFLTEEEAMVYVRNNYMKHDYYDVFDMFTLTTKRYNFERDENDSWRLKYLETTYPTTRMPLEE